MKSRLGFATIALAGFAAVSGFAANASAQNMDQAPGQSPAGPMAPSGPTIGVGNAPYHAVGEDRTEFVRPNGVLLATGGLTLLGSYIPSIVVAASSDHDGDNWLYVPVIGPWVDLGYPRLRFRRQQWNLRHQFVRSRGAHRQRRRPGSWSRAARMGFRAPQQAPGGHRAARDGGG